ncbi:neuritin 1b isoform X2 [Denticeps clupeoides]|uniref:neuritin 1b isoform X2 n=1 Tax=Denticeps clupeoides TaxID=299321 RepID=UPI0010A4ECE0|nr:neuritin isoform X2 [Denticeps clupeoides]
MGLIFTARCVSLLLSLELVGAAGTCEMVFKGFSDCLLSFGENMVNYPEELNEGDNLQTICTYWDDFHSCAVTALADCQEGAVDLWEKLKQQSRRLNFQGSLFELCGGNNAAFKVGLSLEVTFLLTACSTLVTWHTF